MEGERERERERESVEAMDQTLQCIAISTPQSGSAFLKAIKLRLFPAGSGWRRDDEFHTRSQEHEPACRPWIIFLWHLACLMVGPPVRPDYKVCLLGLPVWPKS
jgi:hypothetical protein